MTEGSNHINSLKRDLKTKGKIYSLEELERSLRERGRFNKESDPPRFVCDNVVNAVLVVVRE